MKEDLIQELQLISKHIETLNSDYSSLFAKFANEIENDTSDHARFIYFYKYSTHYKGLIDEEPEGIENSEWQDIVKRLRKHAVSYYNQIAGKSADKI
jgi:hypothetical protein